MCDLFSWIELSDAERKAQKRMSSIFFLTDKDVDTLRTRDTSRKWSDDDVVGHTAIYAYYALPARVGTQCEARTCIPPVFADAVRSGLCDHMLASQYGAKRSKWPRFDANGRVIGLFPTDDMVMNRKAIVYFCRTYRVDGRVFDEKKALKTYDHPNKRPNRIDIDKRLLWSSTTQGYNFWAALWYCMTARRYLCVDIGHERRWSKRTIAAIARLDEPPLA